MQKLWEGKLCNPTEYLALDGKLSWREAYARSMEDATRTQISTEELCSMEWTFNFKHTAGEFGDSSAGVQASTLP